MKISAQDKHNAVISVLKGKSNVSSVSRSLGVSRKTVYSWINRYRQGSLNANYRKGKSHPRSYRHTIYNQVKREVIKNPNISLSRLAHKINQGRHAVYSTLKELDLNTPEKRKSFSRLYSGPGRLSLEIKLSLVKKAQSKESSISFLSKEFGISRKALHHWLKKYRLENHLEEKYVKGAAHYNSFSHAEEKAILDKVISSPELSIHSLAEVLPYSSHGIYNVLARYGLTHKEARVTYAGSHRISPLAGISKSTARVRTILEQFLPSRAPAPPPALATIPQPGHPSFKKFFRYLSASFTLTLMLYLGISVWISGLAVYGFSHFLGISLAATALIFGTIFFIYSMKYYITIALVLSFSQEDTASHAIQRSEDGFLSWLLGLRKSVRPKSLQKSSGLDPDLGNIKLKRYPYISVHIPFYNERNVVERSIRAATNLDYKGEYEVILCDDSTDQTTDIIRDYQKEHLRRGESLKVVKGDGWTLASVEVKPGVTLKHLHRTTRSGFKGGALKLALTLVDPRTEFVSVFDADFVPYPDSLQLFLKYFQATAGTLDFTRNSLSSRIAAVQGYQWHVLNKSENWITRGVRCEYAGSYVIERSGAEIYGGLKQISGSVYMIRRDVLEEVGWGTSITEDFELTLKLYNAGYKVIYTPYIQAPAECVSSVKRLIRQRMRWSEGHSQNVKKMFRPLILSSNLTLAEKLELLYLSPYYLQAFFFLVGTFSWLLSELLFNARLPFWTVLWGWSLVLTNMFSLPLMNAVGIFLEEGEEHDYLGIASFFALSYILVPYQAYASLKGFLEKEEGGWFRTPKSGRITDVFTRGAFYRLITGILPSRSRPSSALSHEPRAMSQYLALASANNQFNHLSVKSSKNRYWGKIALVFVVGVSSLLSFVGNQIPQGAIADLPIQARIEVAPVDNPSLRAFNVFAPKEVLASASPELRSSIATSRGFLVLSFFMSISILIYLIRTKRSWLRKTLRPALVILLVSVWLLTNSPAIWLNPRFPPRISEALAAVSVQSSWSEQYDSSTAYPSGVINSSYTIGAGTNRILVVAISSTATVVGTQIVSVSYGGQSLSLAQGDASATDIYAHTYLYYLNDAGISAASNSELSVTITGQTHQRTWVYAAVYAGVSQSNLFTSARNYNSTASSTAVGPFDPTLTIDEGDQAVEIVTITRSSAGNSTFSVSSWATGWTTAGIEESHDASGTLRPHMYIRDRNVTTSASDGSQHTADSTSTYKTMTAMSLNPETQPYAITLYNDDGGSNQIAFTNTRQNTGSPVFRVSATDVSSFDRFQLELNTASDFTGTSYTQTFSGTYSSGTPYNITASSLSPSLPTTDGATYYVRVRASNNSGSEWGGWSTASSCCSVWTYTYKSASGQADWFQTTDEQFATGTSSNTEVSGSDSVQLSIEPGTVTTQSAWAEQYDSTSYPSGVVNSSYTIGAGTRRLLVVAISSSRTTVGSQTVSVSYGGQSLTLAQGDAGSTVTYAHTYLYYLNDAGIESASNDDLSVTISDGTSLRNWVYAAVFADVDQTTLFTSARNYNSDTYSTTVGPFSPALTIAEGDQAIEIVTATREGVGNGDVTITSWDTGWTTAGIDENHSVRSVRPHMYIRNRNVTTAADDGSAHTIDRNESFKSMTAMSIKPYSDYYSSGTIMSPAIDYDWFYGAGGWETVNWSETETYGTVKVQVYYTSATACDTIVPDGALSNNSTGFTSGPIDISDLSTSTYNQICLKATLAESGSGTPYLNDWVVTVPEFSLIFLGIAPLLPGVIGKLKRRRQL